MIFLAILYLASSMNSAKEEGKCLGKTGGAQGYSQINCFQSQDFVPKDLKGKSFDPEKAKEEARACSIDSNLSKDSETSYLRSPEVQGNKEYIEDGEYFLHRSENISQNPELENLELEEAQEISIETCQQTDAPYPMTVIRDLEVEVAFVPAELKDVKVCNHHSYRKKFQKKKDAEKKVQELRQSFSKDKTLRYYKVNDPKDGGLVHRYLVEAQWGHVDDAETCNNYQTQLKEIQPSRYVEKGDAWIYSDGDSQALAKTPDCTFVKSECLDSTASKNINGKEVHRQCWKEKLFFLCQLPNSQECPFIKNQNCELIKKQCLQEGPFGCSLWELTFKCYSKIIKKRVGKSEFYGLDEEAEYEPNDSFSEIAAKLAVFDAIKKDLEQTQTSDARMVQVFKGQRMQCSKSVTDELMYDCCFGYSGIAKEIGLAHCNADEIALSEMRESGLCHYVGSYEGKFCDLWKSRDEHVFCCFGSKLARVLQENARGQLGIGWSKPKDSDCRGLSLAEISKIDFSKMDFSELYADYEKKLPKNFKSKLENLEEKIKEKVKKHEEENKE